MLLLVNASSIQGGRQIKRGQLSFLLVTFNDFGRLQSVIKKAKRFGYLPSSFPNFGELCADADENLFSAVRYNPQHVLHTLLPSVKTQLITSDPDHIILPFPATSLLLAVKIS